MIEKEVQLLRYLKMDCYSMRDNGVDVSRLD